MPLTGYVYNLTSVSLKHKVEYDHQQVTDHFFNYTPVNLV